MGGVEAGDRPVILDPEVKLATLGIRQADHVGDEVAITEPAAVALELDHQALAFGNVAGHRTSPFSRNGFGQAVKQGGSERVRMSSTAPTGEPSI